MAEPFERPLNNPTPRLRDEVLLVRLLLDEAVAHTLEAAPLLATLGREGIIEEGQAPRWATPACRYLEAVMDPLFEDSR